MCRQLCTIMTAINVMSSVMPCNTLHARSHLEEKRVKGLSRTVGMCVQVLLPHCTHGEVIVDECVP